ncbi:hypothetical protein ACMXYX_17695 (plasmid) [Neptuniibacter sp. QD72_48]|uniref:hypothetical protein n=1 Tax=Neptuniibacter sp. QD72_48 TaxID=3398214 RepID=UPI0039F51C2F
MEEALPVVDGPIQVDDPDRYYGDLKARDIAKDMPYVRDRFVDPQTTGATTDPGGISCADYTALARTLQYPKTHIFGMDIEGFHRLPKFMQFGVFWEFKQKEGGGLTGETTDPHVFYDFCRTPDFKEGERKNGQKTYRQVPQDLEDELSLAEEIEERIFYMTAEPGDWVPNPDFDEVKDPREYIEVMEGDERFGQHVEALVLAHFFEGYDGIGLALSLESTMKDAKAKKELHDQRGVDLIFDQLETYAYDPTKSYQVSLSFMKGLKALEPYRECDSVEILKRQLLKEVFRLTGITELERNLVRQIWIQPVHSKQLINVRSKGLYRGSKKIVRKYQSRFVEKGLKGSDKTPTGRDRKRPKKELRFEWEVKPFGKNIQIQCKVYKKGNKNKGIKPLYARFTFADSLAYIKGSIKDFSIKADPNTEESGLEKGDTPLVNTDPVKYMTEVWKDEEGNHFPADEIDLTLPDDDFIKTRFYKLWREEISNAAIQYCCDDVQIMMENGIGKMNRVFKKLMSGTGFEHLNIYDFMTANQAGLAAMIAMSGDVLRTHEEPNMDHRIIHDPKNQDWINKKLEKRGGWARKSEDRVEIIKAKYSQTLTKDGSDLLVDIPLVPAGQPAIAKYGTFWMNGRYAVKWGNVCRGGMNQIFTPCTKAGHRIDVFDANAMYMSVMALIMKDANGNDKARSMNYRFIDPRKIRPLKWDLVGRKAILKHLEQFSGMYLVEMSPLLKEEFKKYPVFPVSIAGDHLDDQTLFPDWEDGLRIFTTGEELRYVLEQSEIKDDDIRCVAKESLFAPFLKYSPLENFARKAYGLRKKAIARGDLVEDKCLKQMMTAAGFGVLQQVNGEDFLLRSDNSEPINDCLFRLRDITPTYKRWSDIDKWAQEREQKIAKGTWVEKDQKKYNQDRINVIKRYCRYYYREVRTFNEFDGTEVVVVNLPNKLAPHTIRCWGAQITAYARITLHSHIMKATDAGYTVAYCDTDSVHLQVPVHHSVEMVMENLHNQGFCLTPLPIKGELATAVFNEDRNFIRYVLNDRSHENELIENLKAQGFRITGKGKRLIDEDNPKIDKLTGEIKEESFHYVVESNIPEGHYKTVERLKHCNVSCKPVGNLGEWGYEVPYADNKLLPKMNHADPENPIRLDQHKVGVKFTGDEYNRAVIQQPRMVYLAPKHYYYLDQHGNALNGKVKGLPKSFIKMRMGLNYFNVQVSRLGDRRGLRQDIQVRSDLERNIRLSGNRQKRDYYSPFDSDALVLRQPEKVRAGLVPHRKRKKKVEVQDMDEQEAKNAMAVNPSEEDSMFKERTRLKRVEEMDVIELHEYQQSGERPVARASWNDYAAELVDWNLRGRNHGLLQALEEYTQCDIGGEQFRLLHERIDELYETVQAMSPDEKTRGFPYILEEIENFEEISLEEQGGLYDEIELGEER